MSSVDMSTPQIAIPSLNGFTHRWVDVGGIAIHIAEAGSGDPVLLIHGWPQHWYAWRKVAPRLAHSRHAICVDLRGFGWSDAPAGAYDKPALAADVIGLLDALGLDRVDLIAHDWGAWIGFMLCLEHPERFAHYLALNIYTPWPDGPSLRGLGVLARLWYQVVIATPGLGATLIARTPLVRRMIRSGAVHDAWSEEDLEVFSGALKTPARVNASVHLYRTFLLRELLPFLRGQFEGRRLAVPTLLLHGTRDIAIDHRSLGRWQEHADSMSVELREDSGHFIAEELPDIVAARARELFDSGRGAAGEAPAIDVQAREAGT
jgi:pimeloyl-ACP methyl ester carboxylesterase